MCWLSEYNIQRKTTFLRSNHFCLGRASCWPYDPCMYLTFSIRF